MIGEWIRKQTSGLFMALARVIVRMGISANAVTLLGLLLSCCAAYLIAANQHVAAGAALVAAGLLDGLDGSVARVSGQQTKFGAFWDSIIDRFSESVTLLGVMLFYLAQDSETGIILTFVSVVSSMLVSYTRARAEGLDVYFRGGILTRLERVVVLIGGLLLGELLVAIWIVAVLSTITVFQRIYLTWSALQKVDANLGQNSADAER